MSAMQTTGERVLAALQSYHLEKEGDNATGSEYRCNSPLRPGSNSQGFKVKVAADGEHGSYYDHVSGDKGSLYDLAEKLNIEHPKGDRVEVPNSKRKYRDLADYAEAHGVPVDVFAKNGWSETIHKGRPAFEFKTPSGVRYRFIDGKPDDDVYISAVGYKKCWYGLRRALQMADGWFPLVICNGEASTLVAQYHNVPAACATGGEAQLPDHLIAELRQQYPGGPIFLAYDCDGTGRRTAEKVKAQLTGYEVAILDLGLSDKGDLADFCKLYTTGARDRLLELRDKPPTPPTIIEGQRDPLEVLAEAANALSKAVRQDEKSREQMDLVVVLAKLQAELDRVSMNHAQPVLKSFQQLAGENLKMLEFMRQHPDPVRGLRSYIPSLDRAIGGFTPEVYVIYGATNMGKSTLAVSFAREFIKQAPGLIVPTEANPNRWLTKLAAAMTKISSDRIESGTITDDENDAVLEAYRKIAEKRCHMMDTPSPTPGQVRAAALAGIKECGYQWVIVDSAQKMTFPGASGVYDITTGVSNGLQSLFREANIPIIITSQVGRDLNDSGRKGRRMPQLDDGYGSGVIEHNAGVVMGLYHHQYYVDMGLEDENLDFPPDMSLVRILKNRWNPGSRINAVRLTFQGGAGFYERHEVSVNLNDVANGRTRNPFASGSTQP